MNYCLSDEDKFPNLIVCSAPLAISETFPTNHDPYQVEGDLFWEAPEHSEISFNEGSSLQSFDHSSINSELLSWAETSQTTDYSLRSHGSHTSNEPSPFSTKNLAADLGTGQNIEAGAQEEFRQPHQCVLPTEGVSQMSSDSSLEHSSQWYPQALSPMSGKTLLDMYSDDPFMGWANKRSSQMCEDYGWVLSHVETL
jgi:hypothetical protein